MTRGDILRHALAFAMRGLRLKRAPLGLSEETRNSLADKAVTELQRRGHWKELDEESPVNMAMASHPGDKRQGWQPGQVGGIEPIPKDDPIALIEWGKRNIQSD